MTAQNPSSVKVPGYCPMGCGQTLFTGAGGYITCSWIDCPRPTAVSDLLEDRETEHIVNLTDDGWTLRHPLRERVEADLFACHIGEALEHSLDYRRTPIERGRWRLRYVGHDPVSSSLGADLLDWERVA